MGKGCKRRPAQISSEENQLRWQLAFNSSELNDIELKALKDKIQVLEDKRNEQVNSNG